MTDEQQDDFERLALPLIEWINKNSNPHSRIIIDQTSAELVSGDMVFYTQEFLKD